MSGKSEVAEVEGKAGSKTPAGSPVANSDTGAAHCPYRRTTDLLQRLAPGKMRIGFLIGAGCPLAVREKDKPLIPEILGLTADVRNQLTSEKTLAEMAEKIWAKVSARNIASPTIEDVLSHIRTLRSLCGSGGVDGFKDTELDQLDAEICKHVRAIVKVPLPERATPYRALATWIRAISRDKPVEVFTTNYDLLLEHAFDEQRAPYFDGFIGSDDAFLDEESMVVDDLPARWARLWKIHGSINWWMNKKKKIRRTRDSVEGEQLLIYPSHLKYEQSRQMPYSAMLDRLRTFLRSDQCVLLTCGYSFADDHINDYLGRGLANNPNASCLAMIFNDRADADKAVELAKRHANLTVLAADGAVVGTVSRKWSNEEKASSPAFEIAVTKAPLPGRSKAPDGQWKWLLGDFDSLGRFLANQLSNRDIEQEHV